jgi:hypothetical protein
MRKIPSGLYKKQSLELVDYLVNNYCCIPDRIFYLNSSICLELLLKNLIIYKVYQEFLEKDNDEKAYQEFIAMVKEKMKIKGHNLDELLNIDPELRKFLSIDSISKINGDFVNQFQINFNDQTFLLIPTLEALRYGIFANNQHVAEIYDKEKLKELLKKTKKYIINLNSY